MTRCYHVFAVGCLVFSMIFGTARAWAQENAADDAAAAESTAESSADGSAAATFNTRFQEWNQILTRANAIRLEYKIAEPDARQALSQEYNQLLEQGDKILPELKSTAEAAYAADPTGAADARQFVESMMVQAISSDDYDEAYRLATLLLEHNTPAREVLSHAGIAAYELGKVDEAKEFFEQADQADALIGEAELRQIRVAEYAEDWNKEQEIRAAEAESDDLPRVKLETTQGDVVIELFENEAPNTVANFVNLVEKGFYNGLAFHRVLHGFMAQGGDPKGDGTGGPGYHIPCECYEPNARKHFRGSLSMAHAGRDTGGSQFFLTFVATHHLDGRHTVFGRVIEGFDVLPHLMQRDPARPSGVEPDKIVQATVVRKRDHEYQPETLPSTK